MCLDFLCRIFGGGWGLLWPSLSLSLRATNVKFDRKGLITLRELEENLGEACSDCVCKSGALSNRNYHNRDREAHL